jgi:glycosyltransferase involved in cell wall biosynthesis
MRLSAIVTNYNHGAYLYEAIRVLAKQSRTPDEIILVDDASTDDSHAVIGSIERDFPEVIVIRHDRNLGVNAAVETGLGRSTGDFFANLGADDPVSCEFFERATAVLSIHPNAGFCSGEHQIIFPPEQRRPPCPITLGLAERPRFYSPTMLGGLFRARSHLSLPTSPAIWRRTVLNEAGGFQVELEWLSDWFAALVVAFRHGYGYMPGILQTIRYSPRSYSISGMANRDEFNRLMLKLLRTLDKPEYSDVQAFFRIPAVLSRFGFRLLNVLIGHPEYHRYLSHQFLTATTASESLGSNLDLTPLKDLNTSDLAVAFRGVLDDYAECLLQHSDKQWKSGNLTQAIAFSNKAIDASPNHKRAAAFLLELEQQATGHLS